MPDKPEFTEATVPGNIKTLRRLLAGKNYKNFSRGKEVEKLTNELQELLFRAENSDYGEAISNSKNIKPFVAPVESPNPKLLSPSYRAYEDEPGHFFEGLQFSKPAKPFKKGSTNILSLEELSELSNATPYYPNIHDDPRAPEYIKNLRNLLGIKRQVESSPSAKAIENFQEGLRKEWGAKFNDDPKTLDRLVKMFTDSEFGNPAFDESRVGVPAAEWWAQRFSPNEKALLGLANKVTQTSKGTSVNLGDKKLGRRGFLGVLGGGAMAAKDVLNQPQATQKVLTPSQQALADFEKSLGGIKINNDIFHNQYIDLPEKHNIKWADKNKLHLWSNGQPTSMTEEQIETAVGSETFNKLKNLLGEIKPKMQKNYHLSSEPISMKPSGTKDEISLYSGGEDDFVKMMQSGENLDKTLGKANKYLMRSLNNELDNAGRGITNFTWSPYRDEAKDMLRTRTDTTVSNIDRLEKQFVRPMKLHESISARKPGQVSKIREQKSVPRTEWNNWNDILHSSYKYGRDRKGDLEDVYKQIQRLFGGLPKY